MPSGGRSGGGGENVNHFGGIRLRITGSCNLIPTFFSLDDVFSETLLTMPISSTNTGREPLRLSNFVSQRAYLELKTIAINEIFRINRIVIFTRPIWTGYPGNI